MIDRIEEHFKEGKYADLWSVNHTLSGIVLGAILFNFGLGFWLSLLISLALFVGWETAEAKMGIFEHKLNMIMDVAFDTLGFLFVSFFYFVLDTPFTWIGTSIWIINFLALNLWGYLAAKKRKIQELQTGTEESTILH